MIGMGRPLTFASFLAPNVWPVYEFVAATVGRHLGSETRLIRGSSIGQFEAGDIDVAFLCSPPYLRLAALGLVQAIAAPVLQGSRYEGKPVYFSDVVVRASSPFQSFEDLRGSRWSFNDVDSYSGYFAPLVHLAQLGETPAFFSEWIDAGSHEASIRLILSGEVDASAIDSQVLGIEARRSEIAAGLRTITILGPAPIQPVVIASRLPPSLQDAVRESLLRLHSDASARQALAGGFVERFVPVDEASYEPVSARLVSLARGNSCVGGTSARSSFQSIGL
jgi:phosphonate transport system substrate-binding protein